MIKRLKKVGNGQALFLDKTLLALAGIQEGGEVQVIVDNGSIVITPTEIRHPSDADFNAAMDRVVERRREVLKRLAE